MKLSIRITAAVALLAAVIAWTAPADARGSGSGRISSGRSSSGGVHSTRSYTTKSGKTVRAYKATNPNGTQRDNFSAKGNVNPYTGKRGTKKVTH